MEAEGTEEKFRIVLKLLDNMSDQADLLSHYGKGFLESFLGNANRKDDIDNCILAYESAIYLTPQGHSCMSSRLDMLGVSLYHCFELTGDLYDIAKAILSQQEALQLIPEGHSDMIAWLNNLGVSFIGCFEHTGDLADITNAISCHQKVIHLTPVGDASMPRQLSNLHQENVILLTCLTQGL